MDLDDIQAMFFQECEECLAAAEEGLRALEEGSEDSIDAVFRAVHSVKGGAGAFGHERLVAFAHQYETVLDLVRSHQLAATPDLVQLLHRSRDMLDDHVSSARDGRQPPVDAELLSLLSARASGNPPVAEAIVMPEPESVAEATDAPVTLNFRPHRGALLNGGEPLRYLRELERLGALSITLDSDALPTIEALDPAEAYLAWRVEFPAGTDEAALREVFEFIADDCDLSFETPAAAAEVSVQPESEDEFAALFAAAPVNLDALPVTPAEAPAAPPAAAAAKPATDEAAKRPGAGVIRVDIEKVDRLVDVVGELVIAQSMLAQRLVDAGVPSSDALENLSQLIRDLQDAAMSMRAQPVKAIFSRVPRIVRDLEVETGKKVNLEVTGETTEVDKTVIERLGEPLTHLIRNAIDHGLETPDERVAVGKPPEGTIRLAAEHRGGLISIRLIDDGRGVDHVKVRAKAVERGIISPDAVISDDDALNLLFAPGFSTAAKISNISGRGVGLDVVRQNIQALGGRVSISTQVGEGTCFTLTLPLTLAVLDGMLVGCGGQTYVVSVDHVVDCMRPTPAQLKSLGEGAGLVQVRGRYVPVVSLARVFSVEDAITDPTQAVLLLVESERHGTIALHVDQIIDQRQVVIKSLDGNCGRIDGIAGATILGDGRVALILDIDSICRSGELGSAGIVEEA